MVQIVCGQCENRHVIETLGADVMFAALTVSSVESSRSSAELSPIDGSRLFVVVDHRSSSAKARSKEWLMCQRVVVDVVVHDPKYWLESVARDSQLNQGRLQDIVVETLMPLFAEPEPAPLALEASMPALFDMIEKEVASVGTRA